MSLNHLIAMMVFLTGMFISLGFFSFKKYESFMDRVRSVLLGIFFLSLTTAISALLIFPSYVGAHQPSSIAVNKFTPQAVYTPIAETTQTNIRSEKDDMLLIYIPSGEFLMGSRETEVYGTDGLLALPPDRDEVPQTLVVLDEYWIDQTEVTNGQYELCVNEGACNHPSFSAVGLSRYYGNPKYAYYPVAGISWEDANTYCIWAGRRLPSEAEWEKAARGTNGSIYPWGDQSPEEGLLSMWVGSLHPVGSYPAGASPYGVLDMSGNAWEWTNDLDETTGIHIIRSISGGAFYPYTARAANRAQMIEVEKKYIGFRCAK